MTKRSLISITDLTKSEILRITELAADFEAATAAANLATQNESDGSMATRGLLQGKVIATLFFEPSTRTRLSFESAINRLGARVIGFSDASNTSVAKGETLHDTISVISNYCDMIVMRHSLEGAARYASEVASVPVVNAGDGANQHPSQTLLDLYSIQKTQGRLDGLKVMMVGDLKYGRTVHSLLEALSHFDTEFVFVSPPELRMPAEYRNLLDRKGLRYTESSELADNIADIDILYMTRIQKERFNDPMEYERVKNTYVLRASMLAGARGSMKILHPLPRVGEIATDVDDSPHAYYFKQVENGVYARMAIICYLLNVKK
ncbi:MAG: aspartate carbamoyltransferase [Alistipes sp.]|jgi:aspartate carbamoyltransferase catalytic subunit|nr:aspartate carbamoyltransferase [Alistipes sp.]